MEIASSPIPIVMSLRLSLGRSFILFASIFFAFQMIMGAFSFFPLRESMIASGECLSPRSSF